MAIVQCLNNHYYDDKKNSSCPYCEKLNLSNSPLNDFNEQLTSYYSYSESEDDAQMTEAYGEEVSEYEKTIGIFWDESQNRLTVGWLVCLSGAVKGNSYTIFSGRNFAGRSDDMDIVLTDDIQISREKHFSIVYDPKSVKFYLVAGTGHTYVNDEVVISQIEIKDGDKILVGQTTFIFVPYCKEGREWNEKSN